MLRQMTVGMLAVASVASCDRIYPYQHGAADLAGADSTTSGGIDAATTDGSADAATTDADPLAADAHADTVPIDAVALDTGAPDAVTPDESAPKPDLLLPPDIGPPPDAGPGISGPCAEFANWGDQSVLTDQCSMKCDGTYEIFCFDTGRCGCWILGAFQGWCYGFSYTGCTTIEDALNAGCCSS